MPIYPVRVDGPAKTLEVGPRLTVSGDIEADVALLAQFFGDTKGVNPEKSSPVRVKPRQPAS